MKKYTIYTMLAVLLASGAAYSQRFEKGQIGIELRGGLANGYFFGKDQNPAFYVGAAAHLYTSKDSRWVMGSEFYHKSYDYQDKSIKLAQFTAEGGHYFPIIFDCRQNIVISAGGSAVAGYERLNWGEHDLYDGAILLNKDKFIYGAAASLEVEFFPSDKFILFVNGRERLLWNAVDKFNGHVGIGARLIIR